MRIRLLVAVAVLMALVVAGCGGSDGDSGDDASSDDGADVGADDTATDTDDLPTALITESDFAPVCRETGIAEATAFTAGPGVHKVAVLGGEDPEYGLISVSLPDGWEAGFEDLSEVQLVACANRVAATESELCEGYEDEGLEWSIQTYDATWEITLRDATTAEVVAETTLEAVADGCPVVSFYSEGDPSPVSDFATPDAELEVFLKEYVDP
ncbi:MAG: hypothetical protein ACR2QE_11710 [Acidimicrobiales bacterium]